jgi:hypothetical protein
MHQNFNIICKRVKLLVLFTSVLASGNVEKMSA